MSDTATIATVNNLKAALAKELPLENLENNDASVERCRDLLKQLDDCEMNLKVLADTLIGTVVSKYKSHSVLGPSAKLLVKKWKKNARETNPASRKNKLKAEEATPAEFDSLPPLRQNIAKKLHSLMTLSKQEMTNAGVGEEAFSNMCITCASEIEEEIQRKLGQDRTSYSDKARSLCFNLKKNAELRFNLLMGSTSAPELIMMSSDQLATAEVSQERDAQVSKLRDSRLLDWEQQNESRINEMCGIKGDLLKASLFTCGRCKSVKTTSTQKQTRSADEPMTVFVLCMNCGNRWKC